MAESTPPVAVQNQKDISVVQFTNNRILDEANIQEIGQGLNVLIDERPNPKILLDFSNLTVLSSIAIAKLISLQKKVVKLQGTLKVCCVTPNLLEFLGYIGLDRYIRIYETQEDALRTF